MFHSRSVELAVDFKNIFGESNHLLGVVIAKSIGRFHADVKFAACFESVDGLFERADHTLGNTEYDAFRIVGRSLVYEFLAAVSVDFIKVVAQFYVFSGFDFFRIVKLLNLFLELNLFIHE